MAEGSGSALKVGINAIFLEPGMGGLETYVKEIVPSLLKADPTLKLTVLCNSHGHEMLKEQEWANAVKFEVPLGTRRGLRALYELGPLGFKGRHFDVLHSPAHMAPLATKAANVVVVADTTWITMPDYGKGEGMTVRLWQRVVPSVARRADRVIAISHSAAQDLVRHLRVPEEKIDVIPLGFGVTVHHQPTPGSDLCKRLGSGPIVLNVAAKKAHKNQLRLIQALPAIRSAVPGACLVLPGAPSTMEDRLRAECRRLRLEGAVSFPGYASDGELEGLYKAAAVFAFPSLTEGFGLPVLEAMERNLPVVTSDIPVLREVAGEAALFVDPESADDIAKAVIEALTDEPLRQHLIAAGKQRCATFTWERTASQTLDCWRRTFSRADSR